MDCRGALVSDRSKAKPKFHFRRDGQSPQSSIFAAMPTADAAFVVLHPFYRLRAEEYELLAEDEFELSAADVGDAQGVRWREILEQSGVADLSTLRWLIYGVTDGLYDDEREQLKFRTFLRSERLICPSAGAVPPELRQSFVQMITEIPRGECLLLNRPEAPGWCLYSSTGDLFALCLPEEPFCYLAGVRPVVEAAVERFAPEGFFLDKDAGFDW